MKFTYRENTANFPRLETDVLFANYDNNYKFTSHIADTFRFIDEFQAKRTDLWERFVHQYRINADANGGWRGEYWGKMMRGACFVYSYTKDEKLYNILKETVIEMIASADEQGRVSCYPADDEFRRWDLWSRKYVLLGMQYFLEISDDEELREKVIASMIGQVDYIISKIGPREEGKLPITSASGCWKGLNSASILEPVARLYSLTKEQRFLDFAAYIVSTGTTQLADLFELAYKDQFYPYQYPVTKAYEMISCFEGLLEYYRITKIEKHKIAVVNFANRLLESDFTILGGSGCTHEFFDHSTVRQAGTNNGKILQETCVTVTIMKLMYQLALLTGESKYADAFELSFYNAYLGAVNTEKVVEPMIMEKYPELAAEAVPFDSYSPLVSGTRGNGIGGFQIMTDKHYYGCCACIGAAGLGLYPKMMLLTSKEGLVINLYTSGKIESVTPAGKAVAFNLETAFPKEGTVKITVEADSEEAFELKLRNPSWSDKTDVTVNGESIPATDGYITLCRTWKNGDEITLSFDMTTKILRPISYGSQITMSDFVCEVDCFVPYFDVEDPMAKKHIALKRGPIVFAQDSYLGYSVDDPITVLAEENDTVNVIIPEKDTTPFNHIIEVEVPLANGKKMTVIDYASAGKSWEKGDNKIAAWMLTE